MGLLKNKVEFKLGDKVKHRGRRTLAAILIPLKVKIRGSVSEVLVSPGSDNSGIFKVEWRIEPVGRLVRFNELIAGSDLRKEE